MASVWTDPTSHPRSINLSWTDESNSTKPPKQPRVAVNIYSTGGPSVGRTAEGGNGAGGFATGGSAAIGDGTTFVPLPADLENKYAALSDRLNRLEEMYARSQNQEIQVDSGTWNTMKVRSFDKPCRETKGSVDFTARFMSAPKVVVSLQCVDVSKEANFRANAFATDVDQWGFTIHADSWHDTEIYSCGVTWVAVGR
ncbi:hypothetical protein BDV25DRAFT_140642 [Aspergillus avenaceus]|uniref:H-type lectin domain-containing protein n=1 Tax=Aspergillus avenaceus TaxID=36643 RepID=A0A5N6TU41_ASPAV|nr:hypothetical protein BDV25DRAFT_140642 [Aspergillus avenaceus]